MRSIMAFEVQKTHWEVVQPHVVRYLESKYVNDFFESGALRISTCQKFWDHTDEERGDVHESLIRVSGVAGDGGIFNGSFASSRDSLVLSTACFEDLNEGRKFSSTYDAAIRIRDPLQFAIAVARAVPNFKHGFQSFCLYRNSKHLVLDDFAELFPTQGRLDSEDEMIAHNERLSQYVSARVTHDALLRKGMRFRNQCEYRFVWFTPDATGETHIDIVAPDARQFCQPVSETPAGPDLTVDILGAKMTIMTKFDPNDPDASFRD